MKIRKFNLLKKFSSKFTSKTLFKGHMSYLIINAYSESLCVFMMHIFKKKL